MRLALVRLMLALAAALALAPPAQGQIAQPQRPTRAPAAPASTSGAATPRRDTAVRAAVHETAAPAPPQSSRPAPLSLRPRDAARREPGPAQSAANRSASATNSLVTVAGSLAIVLGLFFIVAVLLRRGMPRSFVQLPGEVFEPLGRALIGPKQPVHLVRCGNKVLLLAISPGGIETLTEITDADEVDRICGHCRQRDPHSSSTAFRGLLAQMGRETDGPGFVGRATPSLVDLANRKRSST